ncbi:MAG: hypothetical protein FWD25_11085 [Clostridia bacterium]|nr:hypothetical protein [Clostridia bacterium]
MRKLPCLLLCLALAWASLSGLVVAEEAQFYMIQDDERMLLEGRDIFSYDSSELYTMWRAWGPADDERIGSIGLGGGEDEYPGFVALDFPFAEFGVLALAVISEPPDPSVHGMLNGQIAQQANYPVVGISVHEPGAIGPLGIHVGMATKEVKALPLHYTQHPSLDEVSDDFDDWLIAYFQDINKQTGGIDTYELQVLVANGVVSYFYVMLDWVKDIY